MVDSAQNKGSGIAAVITAGGRISGEFPQNSGVAIKALLSIRGETLLERVIRAAQASAHVSRVIVVGPVEVRSVTESGGAEWILEQGSGGENVVKGVTFAMSSHNRVVVIASDLPFLESAHIDQFLAAIPVEANFALPLIRKNVLEDRFPESVNTFTRLLEGEVSPGSLIYVEPRLLILNRELIGKIFSSRKNEFQMAKLLGISFILRFLAKTLSLHHIETRCNELVNGSVARGVLNMPAELAFDIDDPKDYEYVMKIMDNKAK